MTADRNMIDLAPAFRPVAQEFLSRCNAALAPLSVRAIVTWRGSADQSAVCLAGLSNAHAGQSPHNCCAADGKTPASRALDFGVFRADGSYISDGEDPAYSQCGAIAVAMVDDKGNALLRWGGNFRKMKPDWDHVEDASWHLTP